MADNEEREGRTARGNDWEVVSLTASTYAAAPGPKEVGMKDGDEDSAHGKGEAGTSRAIYMSGHFGSPPSQHEDLPLEPDNSAFLDEGARKNVATEVGVEKGDISTRKDEEIQTLEGLNVIDEKGDRLLISGKEFEESTSLQDLNVSEKEQSSNHGETGVGESTTHGETLGIPEINEPPEQGLDFPVEALQSPEAAKDGENDDSDLPSEAWWKRRAGSFYAHAKEANAFWSIFIVAAFMGLVILGHRWQTRRVARSAI